MCYVVVVVLCVNKREMHFQGLVLLSINQLLSLNAEIYSCVYSQPLYK